MAIAEQEYDFLGNAHGPDVSYFGPPKQRLLEPVKSGSSHLRLAKSRSTAIAAAIFSAAAT
jgi:hypothetical protein